MNAARDLSQADIDKQWRKVARAYVQAMDSYSDAMYRGNVDRADRALDRMRDIQNKVTLTVRPGVAI